MILEPKKIKSITLSIVSPSICHEVMANSSSPRAHGPSINSPLPVPHTKVWAALSISCPSQLFAYASERFPNTLLPSPVYRWHGRCCIPNGFPAVKVISKPGAWGWGRRCMWPILALPLPGIVEKRDQEKKLIFSSCPGKGNKNMILICL